MLSFSNDSDDYEKMDEQQTKPYKVKKLKKKECAICLEPIGKDLLAIQNDYQKDGRTSDGDSEKGFDMDFPNKTFMRTPCNHAFHVQCL